MIRFKVRRTPTVELSVAVHPIQMHVANAVVVAADSRPYDGPYEVTPKVEAQTLPTKQKFLSEDIHVLSVPFYEADNKNGTTIYIASEV